jgi:hypothetical protein
MRHIITVPIWLVIVLLYSCNTKGPGCNDPAANNIDPSAIENDGSCMYDSVWIAPDNTFELNEALGESSGLIFWDGLLWTHNDNTDTRLYGIDPETGEISREYLLTGVENTDWEEISQDAEFIYIGDIGNNRSGNRTDLHILRIDKGSLKSGDPLIDTIWFSYGDQNVFIAQAPNQTEYDCEAFVVSQDSIYLFTKQWLTAYTSLYAIPKRPGSHVARKISTINIQGLVSGACYLESDRLLVLCGYNSLLNPFLYLMYDYSGHQFFSGNRRKINLSLPFTQVEGIASPDGFLYHISNETFVHEYLPESRASIHQIDLKEYLEAYL